MKRFRFFIVGLCLATSSVYADDVQWKKLTWTATDGTQLVGLYRPASRPSALTWVLLHGLGSSKDEWKTFGIKLSEQGNGVFIYDARGHYESNHGAHGTILNYQEWHQAGPGSPWDAMPADLAGAVHLLKTKQALAETSIAIGGASVGANVALVYASQHPEVPALLLLSPGMEYAGIQTPEAWKHYAPRPVMLAASPGDAYAYSTVNEFCRNSTYSFCPLMQGQGTAHGVQMFKDEAFTKKLLDWMKGQDGNRNRRPS